MNLIEFSEPPERDKFDALLRAYYRDVISGLVSLGGPNMDLDVPIADFWAHVDQFLPPDGCLYVAEKDGRWLGTGALRQLPGERGELKRLFVHDDARGLGLGRSLVKARIEFARRIGLKELLVDTIQTTKAMQAIYTSLGFEPCEPYPGSASYAAFPEIREYMLFFRKDIL